VNAWSLVKIAGEIEVVSVENPNGSSSRSRTGIISQRKQPSDFPDAFASVK
jgi:hypothetical protein